MVGAATSRRAWGTSSKLSADVAIDDEDYPLTRALGSVNLVQGFFCKLAQSVLRCVRFSPRQELRRSTNDELPKGAEGEQQIACFIVASRQLCIAVSAETPTSVECFWSGRVN
jgi:hypothetical protein